MNAEFKGIIDKFPIMMEKLNNSPFITKHDLREVPDKGIYVFYENDIPVYTGRSRRLKSRLREHSRQSAGHTSATYAFNLAKRKASRVGINLKRKRKNLESDPRFAQIYKETKERVAKMRIKVIGIDDPVKQTLFEVYASLELKTDNKWETH